MGSTIGCEAGVGRAGISDGVICARASAISIGDVAIEGLLRPQPFGRGQRGLLRRRLGAQIRRRVARGTWRGQLWCSWLDAEFRNRGGRLVAASQQLGEIGEQRPPFVRWLRILYALRLVRCR
jgi:hypothetical protein